MTKPNPTMIVLALAVAYVLLDGLESWWRS